MAGSDPKAPIAANLRITRVLAGEQNSQQIFEALQQRKDVAVKKLDGGGVEIILKPQPWTIWIVIAIGLVVSGLLLLMGVAEDHEWFDTEIHYQPAQFYMYGTLGFVACFTAAVVRLAWGRPRPIIFQAHPDRLEVDFYTAGDHIVRKYHADEIKGLDVGGGLQIVLHNTAVAIAPFADEKALELIKQMIALTLGQR